MPEMIYLFCAMLFCHVLDDFTLQGIMKDLKQKAWWQRNAPDDPKYAYDYIPALLAHSFSWAFMVSLPLAFYLDFDIPPILALLVPMNALCHAWIDHLKANLLKISLVQDQLAHVAQILITLVFCFMT